MNSLILSAFLAISQVAGGPDILLPDRVRAQVGAFVPITAQTRGEVVKFVALDPGLSVFPANLLSDKKTTVVVATKNGSYRILAYTSINNIPTDPAFTTVIIGDGPAPDPDPNPGPDKPDELKDNVRGIYGGLQEADKENSVKQLGQVYQLDVVECDNPKYLNLGQLYAAVRSISFQNLKAGKIEPIRDVLANELDKVLGTDPNAALDANMRKKCKDQFNRVAKILGGLNG